MLEFLQSIVLPSFIGMVLITYVILFSYNKDKLNLRGVELWRITFIGFVALNVNVLLGIVKLRGLKYLDISLQMSVAVGLIDVLLEKENRVTLGDLMYHWPGSVDTVYGLRNRY